MTYTFRPRGVCSQQMQVEVDEQGVIRDLQVLGGCSGNLQGIAALSLPEWHPHLPPLKP